MTRRLNIAVVGLGVGNAHCELILQHPDKFDLVGVCDFDISKLDKFRDHKGICRTSNFEDILMNNFRKFRQNFDKVLKLCRKEKNIEVTRRMWNL